MAFERTSGVLVHPTSLPSYYGIGDFGPHAHQLIHFLEETGQSLWQVLPLTPTGYGDSPYASYSAFAGNIFLISPDVLCKEGLLQPEDCAAAMQAESTKVDYDKTMQLKTTLLQKAAANFYSSKKANYEKEFTKFIEENSYWLTDYTEFVACFEAQGKKPWSEWDDKDMASANKKGRKKIQTRYAEAIAFHTWAQFEFFRQWNNLKEFAHNHGVQIVGDIPIFVDHNSADVWANKKYFSLKKDGSRDKVAGVPPDFFSETGQLWGNPQYDWKKLKADGYSWWIERFRQMFNMYDIVRVDHFRGFEAYWEIDANEETAINGRWVKGPGADLFDAVLAALGTIPVIAEDLGVITQGVVDLRERYDFPGMRILQFAWAANAANSFLPHNYDKNTVCYTGTHDNDTTQGWYNAATDKEKHEARIYTRSDGSKIHEEFIRLCFTSSANQAIIPMQDYMGLDGSHRMNMPGTTSNNWQWRYTSSMLESIDKNFLKQLTTITNRNPRLGYKDESIEELVIEEA
jgi:4-alpha-glucanotransferase